MIFLCFCAKVEPPPALEGTGRGADSFAWLGADGGEEEEAVRPGKWAFEASTLRHKRRIDKLQAEAEAKAKKSKADKLDQEDRWQETTTWLQARTTHNAEVKGAKGKGGGKGHQRQTHVDEYFRQKKEEDDEKRAKADVEENRFLSVISEKIVDLKF